MRDLKALVWSSDELEGGVTPAIYVVDGDPNGLLEAPSASLAIDPTSGTVYVKTDTSAVSWSLASGETVPGVRVDELPDGSATAALTDLVVIEHDPSGAKTAQKLTLAQLKTAMGL